MKTEIFMTTRYLKPIAGLVVIGFLSGCITLNGPTMGDYRKIDTEQDVPDEFPTSGTVAQKNAAKLITKVTDVTFDEWRTEYVRVNRGGAGALAALGLAGAVAAGFDASSDVLKGIGFGAGGVITFEEFMQTKHGAEVLDKGIRAVRCAQKLANVKESLTTANLQAASTRLNGLALDASTLTQNAQNQIMSLTSTGLAIASDNTNQLQMTARVNVLATIVTASSNALSDDLRTAQSAINTAQSNQWLELWTTVTDIRMAVVEELRKDAVDLSKVFESARQSVNKVKNDVFTKLDAAKNKAKQTNTILDNQLVADAVAAGLTPMSSASTVKMVEEAIDAEKDKLEIIIKKCEASDT